jgi:SHS2 domain-containing protein
VDPDPNAGNPAERDGVSHPSLLLKSRQSGAWRPGAGAAVRRYSRDRMYRFVPHTAELEIELKSESAEGVLMEALHAFAELVGPADGDPVERPIALEAADLPALLAAWLEELVFLSETEELVPDGADLELSGLRLTGVVRGRRGEPRPVVKAVTLHRLRFQQRDGAWTGRVVLDV